MILDLNRNFNKTYDEFFSSMAEEKTCSNVVVYDDFISFYKKLILSILNFNEVFVFDSINERNQKEISEITLDPNFVGSWDELVSKITSREVMINLLTSGTTGKPKSVQQKLSNILRFVKLKQSSSNSNWLFCYAPSHIAGLQVFFQAFLNHSTITYAFESSPIEIGKVLDQNVITNISFTPTFFQLLIPYLDKKYSKVETIAFGGERLSDKQLISAKEKFINAKIRNLYAATEFGTILSSKGKGFQILPELKERVKVVENELLVHKELMGRIGDTSSEWYKTGDLVEFIDDDTFVFVSRKSEVINVGGYNVSPSEIEEVLLKLEFIQSVKVFGRKNTVLGNIVACEIVLQNNKLNDHEELKRQIISWCKNYLTDWKIPRKISFVTELSLTKTGKVLING